MAAALVRQEVSGGAGWILLWPRFSPISFVCSLHVWVVLEINCFYCVHSGKPNAKKKDRKGEKKHLQHSVWRQCSQKHGGNELPTRIGIPTMCWVFFYVCVCVFLPSGALNDILRRRNSSPHVAFSKTTSSVADASPQKVCEGTEAVNLRQRRKQIRHVFVFKGGAQGKTPKLHSDPGAAGIARARGSAVAAHLSTLRSGGSSRRSDLLFTQQVTGGVSSIALKYTSLVVAFQRESGTVSERQLALHTAACAKCQWKE